MADASVRAVTSPMAYSPAAHDSSRPGRSDVAGGNARVLTGYDDCRRLLPMHRRDRPWQDEEATATDEAHGKVRLALRRRVQDVVDDLLDSTVRHLGTDRVVDLARVFTCHLPLAVADEVLGIAVADRAAVHRLARASRTDGLASASAARNAETAAAELRAYLETSACRPNGDRRPVLQHALAMPGDTAPDLADELLPVLTCDPPQISRFLRRAVAALAAHPAELAELRAAPQLLPSAVTELLRFATAPAVIEQGVRERVTLSDGTLLSPGETLLLRLSAANRDPRRYPEHGRLDVRRFARDPRLAAPLAFNHAPHTQTSARIAWLESEVALERLLRRFRSIEVVEAPRWRSVTVADGLDSLWVRLEPYCH
jgi:cytochrome P450